MKPVTVVIRVVRLMTATLAPKSFSMVFMLRPSLCPVFGQGKPLPAVQSITGRRGMSRAVDKGTAAHYNEDRMEKTIEASIVFSAKRQLWR